MSDAFGAIFGGNRGAHHLRSAEAADTGSFRQQVRSLTAALAAGPAAHASSLDQLVDHHELSIVAVGLHGHTGPADGELVMELGPIDASGEPASLRALVVLSQDARAQMAGGRLFFLDHEFEVAK